MFFGTRCSLDTIPPSEMDQMADGMNFYINIALRNAYLLYADTQ